MMCLVNNDKRDKKKVFITFVHIMIVYYYIDKLDKLYTRKVASLSLCSILILCNYITTLTNVLT